MRHSEQGFTMIELMVVVSILAILTAIAAPSFKGLIESWRVKQEVEGLQSAIFYARSEAIKRGGGVVLQKIANNTDGCTLASSNADWGCGWFVCQDTNGNDQCATAEPVLQTYKTSGKTEIQRTLKGGESISFNRWGLPTAAFAFNLLPVNASTNSPAARGLCTSSGGRTAITNSIPC